MLSARKPSRLQLRPARRDWGFMMRWERGKKEEQNENEKDRKERRRKRRRRKKKKSGADF